jgi:hypothetical protein
VYLRVRGRERHFVGERQVQSARHQRLDQISQALLHDLDRPDVNVIQRRTEQVMHQRFGQPRNDSDAQSQTARTQLAARDIVQLAAEAKDVFRVVDRVATKGREDQALAPALEQLRSKVLLERPQLSAERRVSQPELARCGREPALARDDRKVEEVVIVEPLHNAHVAPLDMHCQSFVIYDRWICGTFSLPEPVSLDCPLAGARGFPSTFPSASTTGDAVKVSSPIESIERGAASNQATPREPSEEPPMGTEREGPRHEQEPANTVWASFASLFAAVWSLAFIACACWQAGVLVSRAIDGASRTSLEPQAPQPAATQLPAPAQAGDVAEFRAVAAPQRDREVTPAAIGAPSMALVSIEPATTTPQASMAAAFEASAEASEKILPAGLELMLDADEKSPAPGKAPPAGTPHARRLR